jgi:hypothetical protein
MISKLYIYILRKKIFFIILFKLGVRNTIKSIYNKYFKKNKKEEFSTHNYDAYRYQKEFNSFKEIKENKNESKR